MNRETSRLLRLYPAAYRRLHGEELAGTYADAVAGAGRTARLREAADLAGHALRVRLRATSADPAGRALGAAAPYVVGIAAGHALMVALWIATGMQYFDPHQRIGNGKTALAAAALMALAASAAVHGRWQWTRLLAVATAVTTLAGALLHPAGTAVPGLLHAGLIAVLILGCPPDLPPQSGRARSRVAAMTLLLAVPLVGIRAATPTQNVGPAMWTLVLLAGALLIAVAAQGGRDHRVTGILVASLPWAVLPVLGYRLVGQYLIWIAITYPLAYGIGLLLHRLRPRTMGNA
ncbi:hypothetical protein OG897_17195 [Streptomyces sp. NBC_00237]|uniref:hypothetical protein n=1 Tax=Streptomyces sp. NBC_00237 TaxID=2975687 RepID=UPI0022562DD2|nr:hypothetical protein [Streptomyces sp. NBC_00237]MCX5203177.1 hypothetical protein [Streptomyces sp. NBC_00237]